MPACTVLLRSTTSHAMPAPREISRAKSQEGPRTVRLAVVENTVQRRRFRVLKLGLHQAISPQVRPCPVRGGGGVARTATPCDHRSAVICSCSSSSAGVFAYTNTSVRPPTCESPCCRSGYGQNTSDIGGEMG
jgi:hypothetical protein